MRRAIELEPCSIFYNTNLGRLYFAIRQYDNARDRFRKTLELEPNSRAAHDLLGDVYEMKGMQNEAVAEWSRALVLGEEGEMAASLNRVYAASGFEAARASLWRHRVERLNEQKKRQEYVPAIEYVNGYARAGDKEQAFAWLEKALDERNRSAFEVRSNPMYDNLRNDPRFQVLLHRAGLN